MAKYTKNLNDYYTETFQFYEADGVTIPAADPDNVVLTMTDPADVATQYTVPTNEIQKLSTARYRVSVKLTSIGIWHFHFSGEWITIAIDGGASDKGSINVEPIT